MNCVLSEEECEREGERLGGERRPVVDVQQCASPAVGWLPCLGVLPLVNMRRGRLHTVRG